LDGRELRGRPVRVDLDESVRIFSSVSPILIFLSSSAAVSTIIDVMTVTGMTVTETIATVKIVTEAGTAPGRPPAVIMMTADPGLRQKEIMMIEGLQGTMITVEGVLLTEETLTTIMTVAGTITTGAETTKDATRKMIATKKDLSTLLEIVIVEA
jgi:hypothetical protein